MKSDDFFRRIAKIRMWTANGKLASYKPLLLLLALGRLSRGEPKLASYEHEIRPALRDLFDRFASPSGRPLYPFWRLRNDGLWEIPGAETLPTNRSGDVRESMLIRHGACGGFPEPLQHLLQGDPVLVERAAAYLLAANFSESRHLHIRQRVGLMAPMVLDEHAGYGTKVLKLRPRDPDFRPAVLAAYEDCCVVCDSDVQLEGEPLGLEAAHIWAHAAGGPDGPDQVSNGLALCALHHRFFDAGAIGLHKDNGGFSLLVSDAVEGRSVPYQLLRDACGQPVRPPKELHQRPDADCVAWHRRHTFRGEPARP